MAAITGFVAVGVFVGVIQGAPDVTVMATDTVYKTKEACEEHLTVVREKANSYQDTQEQVLKAYGLVCTEIKVETRKANEKPDA